MSTDFASRSSTLDLDADIPAISNVKGKGKSREVTELLPTPFDLAQIPVDDSMITNPFYRDDYTRIYYKPCHNPKGKSRTVEEDDFQEHSALMSYGDYPADADCLEAFMISPVAHYEEESRRLDNCVLESSDVIADLRDVIKMKKKMKDAMAMEIHFNEMKMDGKSVHRRILKDVYRNLRRSLTIVDGEIAFIESRKAAKEIIDEDGSVEADLNAEDSQAMDEVTKHGNEDASLPAFQIVMGSIFFTDGLIKPVMESLGDIISTSTTNEPISLIDFNEALSIRKYAKEVLLAQSIEIPKRRKQELQSLKILKCWIDQLKVCKEDVTKSIVNLEVRIIVKENDRRAATSSSSVSMVWDVQEGPSASSSV